MEPGVAVVGCGHWGRNLVRNFAQLGALAAVCDSDEAALAAASVGAGVRRFPRLEDGLADPAVHAVVLATPAVQHYPQAAAALRAGRHVFVEKPLALKYEDGVRLVAQAADAGRVLMVGHILEYHPAVTVLRELVRSGELGSIRYLYSNRLNLGRVRREENILWSFAPHDISVITTLVDETPYSVSAQGGHYLQEGVADVTVSNLVFADGVRAHIFVSWLHPYKEQRLVVIGDRKMAVFNDTALDGKLKIYDKGIDWKGGAPVVRQTSETTLYIDDSEPLRLECRHFLDCIRTGSAPLTGGANALRVLRILEASQSSLERGGVPVALDEIPAGGPA